MRLAEEEQFSAYGFDYADVDVAVGAPASCMRRSAWGCWSKRKEFEEMDDADAEAVSGAGRV